jgi:hypothetical protein
VSRRGASGGSWPPELRSLAFVGVLGAFAADRML